MKSTPSCAARSTTRWGRFMRRYGYCQDEPALARESG